MARFLAGAAPHFRPGRRFGQTWRACHSPTGRRMMRNVLDRLCSPLGGAGLGLGGAPLGNLYAPLSDEAADQTLEAAWRLGLRYFDTAPLYGHGLSEQRLGRFLRARPRDAFVLSTKVG